MPTPASFKNSSPCAPPCAPVDWYADVDSVALLAFRDVHALVHDELDSLSHSFADLLGRCFVSRLGHHHSKADRPRQEEGPGEDDGTGPMIPQRQNLPQHHHGAAP